MSVTWLGIMEKNLREAEFLRHKDGQTFFQVLPLEVAKADHLPPSSYSVTTTIYMSSFITSMNVLCGLLPGSFFPVIWFLFGQRIQVNCKPTTMCHYQPHENVQSTHWAKVHWARGNNTSNQVSLTICKPTLSLLLLSGIRFCVLDYWRTWRISIHFTAKC